LFREFCHANGREGHPLLEGLATKDKVTGLKQTRRAVSAGRAGLVYLACDADPWLTEPLRALCEQMNVTVENGGTMEALGRAAGISVGTAAVALLAE
jgi:large subunit ribosomal protein L7A